MNRLILIGILWCFAISNGVAQETATLKDESNPAAPEETQASAGSASANSKPIVLVIDADAQKSELVAEVIAALEKAGIATGKAAESAPPANSPISVTLNMRKDESHEKIKQLIEALKSAGVQQIALCEGGVRAGGEEEQNLLILHAPQQGFTRDELHKIQSAAETKADQSGLQLFISTEHPTHTEAGDFFGPALIEEQLDGDDRNSPVPASTEKVKPGTNTATSATSQIAELREAYESESKFTLTLAAVLRQVQNSKDPAEWPSMRPTSRRYGKKCIERSLCDKACCEPSCRRCRLVWRRLNSRSTCETAWRIRSWIDA